MSEEKWEDDGQFRDGIAALICHAGVPAEHCMGVAAEIASYITAWRDGGRARASAYLNAQYGVALPAGPLQSDAEFDRRIADSINRLNLWADSAGYIKAHVSRRRAS